MVLPAFALIDDLRARGVKIADGDDAAEARAQAALDDVSTLIRSVAGIDWVVDDEIDPAVPPVIFTICCAAARRAYENPRSIRVQSVDGYADTVAGDVVGGVELTLDEKHTIEQAVGGVAPGLFTISTTRGILETPGPFDLWDSPVLLDTIGGEPIAWLDPSELPPE